MDEIDLKTLNERFLYLKNHLATDEKKAELKKLESSSYEADFWNDHQSAGEVMKKI